MRMLNEERVPPSQCPYCETVLDCINGIADRDEDMASMKASGGAITVCLNCAQILMFNDDLSLRKLTADEDSSIRSDPRASSILRTLTTIVKLIDRRPYHERSSARNKHK